MTSLNDDSDNAIIPISPERWKLPRALSAFRHRDFSLFSAGQFISLTGSWMQTVALGWLVLRLTHSPFYLGLVTAISTLPILLVTLPAGVIADRLDKRRVLIVTQSLMMVHALALAYLDYTGVIRVWHILALSGFIGLVNAADIPARQSMTVELVGKEDIVNAVALNSAVFNGTRIIGPAIAGAVVAGAGTAVCFLINGISFIGALLALLLMRHAPVIGTESKESVWRQAIEGVKLVMADETLRVLIILTGIISIFAMQYSTIMPAFAKYVLKTGATGLGALMAFGGFGALLGALAVAAFAHKVKKGKVIFWGGLLIPLGLLFLSLVPTYYCSLAAMVVIGFGMMLFLAVSNSVIQLLSPPAFAGRIMAVRVLVFMGFAPFGALQIGALAEHLGVAKSLSIGAIVCLAALGYYLIRAKDVWKLE